MTLLRVLTSKQCTGFVPRKPSIYEIFVKDGRYELQR